MNELILFEEEEAELLTRVSLYKMFAMDHVVDSVGSYSEADRKITEGEHIKKVIKEQLDPIVSERHKSHKEATKFRSAMIDPVENSSQVLMGKMKVFQKVQDEKMAQDKKRLEDEAKKRQEEECLRQAEDMEKAGMPEEAIDAVLDLADGPAPEVHIATPILRSKTAFTPSWDVEVIDEFKVPEDYIIRTVNIQAIKKIVNDKKGSIEIPGIKITETTSTRRNSR